MHASVHSPVRIALFGAPSEPGRQSLEHSRGPPRYPKSRLSGQRASPTMRSSGYPGFMTAGNTPRGTVRRTPARKPVTSRQPSLLPLVDYAAIRELRPVLNESHVLSTPRRSLAARDSSDNDALASQGREHGVEADRIVGIHGHVYGGAWHAWRQDPMRRALPSIDFYG